MSRTVETFDDSSLSEDSSQEVDEERINEIVKAADLVQAKFEEQEDTTEETEEQTTRSGFAKYLFEQCPSTKSFTSRGRVVDIRFNRAFEDKLSESNIVELEEQGVTPKFIELCIRADDGDELAEKISFDDRDEFERVLQFYGDGRLDSLTGAEVLLKPNWESYTDTYSLIVPSQTATSKLRAKLTVKRSEIAPRATTGPRGILNFLLGNLVRLACTMTVISGVVLYMIGLSYASSYLSGEEFGDFIVGATMSVMLVGMMVVMVSFAIGERVSGGRDFIGAFELAFLRWIGGGITTVRSKLNQVNHWLGKQL